MWYRGVFYAHVCWHVFVYVKVNVSYLPLLLFILVFGTGSFSEPGTLASVQHPSVLTFPQN